MQQKEPVVSNESRWHKYTEEGVEMTKVLITSNWLQLGKGANVTDEEMTSSWETGVNGNTKIEPKKKSQQSHT